MDSVQFISIGLVYFMLQFVSVRYLTGRWNIAAIFAAPLLATMICLGILGIQMNIAGSGALMALALPVGIAYLTILLAAWLVTQAVQQQSKPTRLEQDVDA